MTELRFGRTRVLAALVATMLMVGGLIVPRPASALEALRGYQRSGCRLLR